MGYTCVGLGVALALVGRGVSAVGIAVGCVGPGAVGGGVGGLCFALRVGREVAFPCTSGVVGVVLAT